MRIGVLFNRVVNLRALALCVAALVVPLVAGGGSSDTSATTKTPTAVLIFTTAHTAVLNKESGPTWL